jgi:hypothetical protein
VQPRPALLLLYVALSCGEVTGLPSAEPIPVLQGLLILEEPRHLLRVEWSRPTHLPYETTGRPVDESLVDLWLVGPTGDSIRYDPTGSAGEFAAVATVSAGETYHLSGTIAARPVTAQVSLPGALVVRQPAGDTLRLPLEDAVFHHVPFAWRAESAASYQALLVDDDGTTHTAFVVRGTASAAVLLDIAPDTTGELLIIPPTQGVPDTAPLVILGYDRTAAGFFSSTTKGNVHGAFGLFGAAAKTEKVVVWE